MEVQTEQRYHALKRRLDALGYHQPLSTLLSNIPSIGKRSTGREVAERVAEGDGRVPKAEENQRGPQEAVLVREPLRTLPD